MYLPSQQEVYKLYMNLLCRNVLRVLLENLEDEDGTTRSLVFGVLTEMLKQVRESSLPFYLHLSYMGPGNYIGLTSASD
jgi:hypothetical protein